MYKLFLDDLRGPPDGTWVVARSVAAAIEQVNTYGLPHTMSLDHDLGTGVDAPVFLRWLIDRALDDDEQALNNLVRVKLSVHTANPAGRMNLESLWSSFENFVYATANVHPRGH